MRIFGHGEYITRLGKADYQSLQTLRINYFVGNGAECTTGIAGGCTVYDLREYRQATAEEIVSFLEMEAKAYKQLIER